MQLICPKCNSRFDIEKAVAARREAEVRDLAAKLGEHWQIVWEYTDCFRSSEYGDIRPNTRWRILKSIAVLLDSCTFQLHGKRFRTNKHEIVKAMKQMCNRNIWPVKNHTYLFTILSKTADRISAEGMTAKEEVSRYERQ